MQMREAALLGERQRAPEHGLGFGGEARDQVRAVAQRVEVVSRKEVRIRGMRSELLRTLTAASGVEAAVLGVRAFEPKWRARNDSNVRPSDS